MARVPVMPVEIMLLPRWFPFHLSRISYWARTVVVPLLVLGAAAARRATRAASTSTNCSPRAPERSQRRRGASAARLGAVLHALDRVLQVAEPLLPKELRRRAIDKAVRFVSERLNGEDGLGAIYPAMANAVMMFDALGYPPDHPDRASRAARSRSCSSSSDDEAYCQPCVSPVWDTALAAMR